METGRERLARLRAEKEKLEADQKDDWAVLEGLIGPFDDPDDPYPDDGDYDPGEIQRRIDRRKAEIETRDLELRKAELDAARDDIIDEMSRAASTSYVERVAATGRLRNRVTWAATAALATAVSLASAGLVQAEMAPTLQRTIYLAGIALLVGAGHNLSLMFSHGAVEFAAMLARRIPRLHVLARPVAWLKAFQRIVPVLVVSVQFAFVILAGLNLAQLVESLPTERP